jgi:hypothetical protein
MNKLIPSILIQLVVSTIAVSEIFTIGGNQIEIPAPEGFVKVTDEMTMVSKFVDQMSDPMNDLIAYYIQESDAEIALSGDIPDMEKTFMVKVNKELRNITVSRSDFADLKQMMKKQNKEIFKSIQEQVPEYMDQMSSGVSDEFDVDFAMQVSQMIPLDVHSETTDSMAYSMYINYGIQVEGEDESGVVAATATNLNVSGTLLFLYSYAPKEQLEWTRTSSTEWTDRVISRNSAPPEKIRRNSFDWGSVGSKALAGAIVGGFFALIGMFFKKKK